MSPVFTVSLEDLDDLDRLNKDLATAHPRDVWKCQAKMIRYFEDHPTLLPYLTEAARDKKRAKVESESFGTFQSLHAGGRGNG